MDERRAFLDEVIEHPDDDVPRLIYADWLDEQGDARGEFIRVQCELAQTNRLSTDFYELTDRSEELLAEFGAEWAAELKQDVRKVAFHRGFIDNITMRARLFVSEGEQLVNTIPVHWLRFNNLKGQGEQLAQTDALRRLRYLDLSSLKIPIDDFTKLLQAPHLNGMLGVNLSHLSLQLDKQLGRAISSMTSAPILQDLQLGSDLQGAGFHKAMLDGDGFPELRSLSLGTEFNNYAMSGLGKLYVPKLESLTLRGEMKVADAEGFIKLPMDQLKKLDLRGTRLPHKGIELFANRGAFDNLEVLNLGNCNPTTKTIDLLFSGGHLKNCRLLDLHGTHRLGERPAWMTQYMQRLAQHEMNTLQELTLSQLDRGNLAEALQSPSLNRLRSLRLLRTACNDSDGIALAQSGIADSLCEFSMEASILDDEFIAQLCKREFPNVLALSFDGHWDATSFLTPAGAKHMIESNAFPNLRSLNLSSTNLKVAVLEAIANHPMPELRTLAVEGNRVSDKAIKRILSSDNLPRLKKLKLQNCVGLRNRPKMKVDYGSRVEV